MNTDRNNPTQIDENQRKSTKTTKIHEIYGNRKINEKHGKSMKKFKIYETSLKIHETFMKTIEHRSKSDEHLQKTKKNTCKSIEN